MRPDRLGRRVLLQAGVVLVRRLEQFGAVTLEQRPPQTFRDVGRNVASTEMEDEEKERGIHHGPGAVAPDQGRISACTLGLFCSSLALPSYKRARSLSALLDLLNAETLKIPLFAPAGEHLVKRHRAFGVLALEEALALPFPLAVVVPRRADVLVRGHEGRSGHQLHPLRLSLGGGLHCPR